MQFMLFISCEVPVVLVLVVLHNKRLNVIVREGKGEREAFAQKIDSTRPEETQEKTETQPKPEFYWATRPEPAPEIYQKTRPEPVILHRREFDDPGAKKIRPKCANFWILF